MTTRPFTVEVEETRLDPALGVLRSLDLSDDGSWVGVFDSEAGQWIRGPGLTFPCPERLDFPIVRFVRGSDRLLLASSRTDRGRSNAWLLDRAGLTLTTFCAGDAVQDVLARDERLVFTYFDEGVFGDVSPANEGVAIFDLAGHLVCGYRSYFGQKAVDISDCYAACWGSGPELWFCPYTEFPLVCLDVDRYRQSTHDIPTELRGSRGLATNGVDFFLHSSYSNSSAIYSWRSPLPRATRVGWHRPGLRGLPGGRFLFEEFSSFTVVTPKAVP